MIKNGYTDEYNMWKEIIEKFFYNKCIFNDNIKNVGKFSINPHFVFDDIPFSAKSYSCETENELISKINQMEIIYVVYKSRPLKKIGNSTPYIIRGIDKKDFCQNIKKKIKQPKMDYATKMTATVLEVMKISDENQYNKLIEDVKNLLKDPQYDEIHTGAYIMDYLAKNKLFCNLTCSIMGDTLINLPQFKTTP